MKSFRVRITLLLCIILVLFSFLSILYTFLASKGILFARDTIHFFFGFTFSDVMLLCVTIIIAVFSIVMLTRATTNPIVHITNATKEIAAGNFDIELSLPEKARELRELQKNFNIMVRELKSNETMRQEFISNVSHELRTPLTIISGYADLLSDGSLSEDERKEYTALIASESERLVRLTSNLLRLSKMDSQQISIKQSTFYLDEQIRQAIVLLGFKWQKKKIAVHPDLDHVLFYGDEELLSQVWFNLIENAVKFTDDGGRIGVSLKAEGAAIKAVVIDNGIGMDEATIDRMFEQFYQGDTSRKNEGSGMGLAIIRKIVELHNGNISVESGPKQGSKFIITLPNRLPQ